MAMCRLAGSALCMTMSMSMSAGCNTLAVGGPEVVLESAELSVTVLPEVGARVHAIRAFGTDVMRTPPDPATHRDEPFAWGGYHMLPWANRISPGPIAVLGRTIALDSNFPDGTAIHGEQYATRWEHEGDGTFHTAGGGDDWPWTYTARVTMAVEAATLRIGYALTNTSGDAMPAGLGFHPWFRPPATVHIPADLAFPDNTSTRAEPEAVSGPLDLRTPRPLAAGVDATWVGLIPPQVELTWDDGLRLAMRAGHVGILAVAANLPQFGAVAVELQTHAPDGIRRLLGGEMYAPAVLDPDETLDLTLELEFTRE